MAPRLYANPFVQDAPTVHVVSKGEKYYPGPTITRDGLLIEWVRDVTYSDGTVLQEVVSSELLDEMVWNHVLRRRKAG